MMLYWLYRAGHFIANALPIRQAYAVASAIASFYYIISSSDRKAVRGNLKAILGPSAAKKELSSKTRAVFINFAKYLVDFFRFASMDKAYMDKTVEFRGLENVDKGLNCGKGVILLSAHIGNWELGGSALASVRQPMAAVVLTHKNKRINDFFTSQRMIRNMKPIEIGLSLRGCYRILKKNGLLALLGDRDFSKNGVSIPFFGREMPIPKGPAVLSRRLGACLVPSFMIREEDDTFSLRFEAPIFPDLHKEEDDAIKELAGKYAAVIESYVKRYPTQWYIFREAWSGE